MAPIFHLLPKYLPSVRARYRLSSIIRLRPIEVRFISASISNAGGEFVPSALLANVEPRYQHQCWKGQEHGWDIPQAEVRCRHDWTETIETGFRSR
jgi:hypothetical protein